MWSLVQQEKRRQVRWWKHRINFQGESHLYVKSSLINQKNIKKNFMYVINHDSSQCPHHLSHCRCPGWSWLPVRTSAAGPRWLCWAPALTINTARVILDKGELRAVVSHPGHYYYQVLRGHRGGGQGGETVSGAGPGGLWPGPRPLGGQCPALQRVPGKLRRVHRWGLDAVLSRIVKLDLIPNIFGFLKCVEYWILNWKMTKYEYRIVLFRPYYSNSWNNS